jgi:hypothetical protein
MEISPVLSLKIFHTRPDMSVKITPFIYMATNTIAVYYMHILLLFETIKGIYQVSPQRHCRVNV